MHVAKKLMPNQSHEADRNEAPDARWQARGRWAKAEEWGERWRVARVEAAVHIAGRVGKVFADRFHAHVMKTLGEIVNAVRYVVENFRHHLREDVAPQGVDPCSSAAWSSHDGPVS